jgi:NAD+ kinase
MHEKLIGLIAHTSKSGAAALVAQLSSDFADRNIGLILEQKTAALVGQESTKSTSDLAKECELLVVLGGDGTILQVLHDMGESTTPIFGINLGSLGFLTCVSSASSRDAVQSIATGNFVLSRRTLLTVEVHRGGKLLITRTGLNDAVVSRGALSRLIKLHVQIDRAALTEYNADGLIIATPTGSTAYSLSAGGPVLTPDSGVFAVTPICPHVLTNRSVVVSDQSEIRVTPAPNEQDTFLTVDGQELLQIRSGDTIITRKARRELPLAMLPQTSFFELLRQKLKWSGSAI